MGEGHNLYPEGLNSFLNFYYCRFTKVNHSIALSKTAFKISTIVDWSQEDRTDAKSKTAFKISTIVDMISLNQCSAVSKTAFKISTIVENGSSEFRFRITNHRIRTILLKYRNRNCD